MPTEPPSTEAPRLPTVEIPADHPGATFAILPPDAFVYAYVNVESAAKRPDLMEHVEFQLEHFVSQEELPLAEELLLAVGTRGLTLAGPNSRGDWAVILLGDFSRVEDALRLGAESGAGLSTQVVDTHQGVDIFALVRRRSSGRESEIYLAALNSETLAASPDLPQVREMISRQQGILELPQALAVMVEDWGLSDFLQVIDVGAFGAGSGGEETPLDKQRFFGFHAQLADDSMTTLRALHQFDDEEQAAAAAAWLQEQTEPRWRNIGWGASAMVDEWRDKGATVYGEVAVPDEAMPGLVQGN
jgi:hypothetical protein